VIAKLPKFVRVWIWGPVALTTAFAPLALAQVLQIASLVVRPFSMPLFRRVNTTIAGGVWGYWAWMLEHMAGTEIERSGDPLPTREDAIVLSNHQEMGDVVIIMCLALGARSVAHMKWLVKDIVKYVPGVGWGMMFLDCVFLKRDWARDATTIKRVFSRIADNRLPVWLVSFPEGTRSTPAKLRENQARDHARGRRVYQHLLRPRSKGFAASVTGLRAHVKAVYSVTIGYHGEVPTLVGLIRGDARKVSVHVRRFPIESMAADEAGLSAWLEEEFRAKDQLLGDFAANGRFP
jgi:1-acyl-sn-glycerol-3-phosphate acyltransferase